jgi:hypothetical protein
MLILLSLGSEGCAPTRAARGASGHVPNSGAHPGLAARGRGHGARFPHCQSAGQPVPVLAYPTGLEDVLQGPMYQVQSSHRALHPLNLILRRPLVPLALTPALSRGGRERGRAGPLSPNQITLRSTLSAPSELFPSLPSLGLRLSVLRGEIVPSASSPAGWIFPSRRLKPNDRHNRSQVRRGYQAPGVRVRPGRIGLGRGGGGV